MTTLPTSTSAPVPPLPTRIFANSAATTAGQQITEKVFGTVVEPLGRNTQRTQLLRRADQAHVWELHERTTLRETSAFLPCQPALDESPPQERRKLSWFGSSETHQKELSETLGRAAERMKKVEAFGVHLSAINQAYEAERAAAEQRIIASQKAIEHESDSTSSFWTGWW